MLSAGALNFGPCFGLVFRGDSRHPRPTLLLWGERDGLNPPASVGQKVSWDGEPQASKTTVSENR